MPNDLTFPLAGMTLTLSGPEEGTTLEIGNMSEMLQYCSSAGIPALIKMLKDFQEHFHNPPRAASGENSDIFVSTGSMDSVTKTLECIMETEDTLLMEEAVFSGTLSFLRAWGSTSMPVKTDDHGLVPSALEQVLDEWDVTHPGKPKPKAIYLIPSGSNPTGVTLALDRRQEIYRICCKHDLLILEDDPYYFLQFAEERVPSFYSMDEEARVVRFDSFSKILSSGLRIGFMTGPKELVERCELHQQVTEVNTSCFSQSVVMALLNHWGYEGLEDHFSRVVAFYRNQRDALIQSAERHLNGLCSWSVPDAGMFMWLKIDCVESVREFTKELVHEKDVLVVAGHFFSPIDDDLPAVRLSYSLASPEQMDEAMERMGRLLRSKE